MRGTARSRRHGTRGRQRTEYSAPVRTRYSCFDFSGAGGQNQVFMVKFGYLMVKVGLHKGFPLMYSTRGGSRRLLKIRPQWSEI